MAAAASAAVLLTGVIGAGPSSATDGPFNKGTGSAFAQSVRFNPISGGLSFGIGVAESLAGHQNTVATAESRSANLGIIGSTAAATGCDGGDPTLPKEDQPQALRVDSSQDGAAQGIDNQDPKVPGVNRHVLATTSPYAESLTQSEGLDIPGVMHIGPTVSFASSGIDGTTRIARAVSDVSSISFAGGAIQINGLHWESEHRTGATDSQTGSFSIGSATIAGAPLPTNDPITTLTQLNQVLHTIGVDLRAPHHHVDNTSGGTISAVDPMGVYFIPAEARDSLTGPLFSAIQPVREQFFNALIAQDCGNATYITILDIVLNSTGAGGSFGVELGGVRASTAALNLFQFGSLPVLPALDVLPSVPTVPARLPSTATPAAPAASAASPAATGGEEVRAVDTASFIPGKRGGPMLAVGLGGLLLLLATAEGDRRKMRRAQREIPLEG